MFREITSKRVSTMCEHLSTDVSQQFISNLPIRGMHVIVVGIFHCIGNGSLGHVSHWGEYSRGRWKSLSQIGCDRGGRKTQFPLRSCVGKVEEEVEEAVEERRWYTKILNGMLWEFEQYNIHNKLCQNGLSSIITLSILADKLYIDTLVSMFVIFFPCYALSLLQKSFLVRKWIAWIVVLW